MGRFPVPRVRYLVPIVPKVEDGPELSVSITSKCKMPESNLSSLWWRTLVIVEIWVIQITISNQSRLPFPQIAFLYQKKHHPSFEKFNFLSNFLPRHKTINPKPQPIQHHQLSIELCAGNFAFPTLSLRSSAQLDYLLIQRVLKERSQYSDEKQRKAAG